MPDVASKNYVFEVLLIVMASFMIGVLCYLGQRLTHQSDKLFFATYECDWINQSRSFKQKLIVMRTISQQPLQLKTVKFKLNRQSFYEVILKICFICPHHHSRIFSDLQHRLQQLQVLENTFELNGEVRGNFDSFKGQLVSQCNV
jgi:hypothetical protein